MQQHHIALALLDSLVTLADLASAAVDHSTPSLSSPLGAVTPRSILSARASIVLNSAGGGDFLRYVWAACASICGSNSTALALPALTAAAGPLDADCLLLGTLLLFAGSRLKSFACGAGSSLVLALSRASPSPASGFPSPSMLTSCAPCKSGPRSSTRSLPPATSRPPSILISRSSSQPWPSHPARSSLAGCSPHGSLGSRCCALPQAGRSVSRRVCSGRGCSSRLCRGRGRS